MIGSVTIHWLTGTYHLCQLELSFLWCRLRLVSDADGLAHMKGDTFVPTDSCYVAVMWHTCRCSCVTIGRPRPTPMVCAAVTHHVLVGEQLQMSAMAW